MNNDVVKTDHTTESMFVGGRHMGFEVVGLRIVRNGGHYNVTVVVMT